MMESGSLPGEARNSSFNAIATVSPLHPRVEDESVGGPDSPTTWHEEGRGRSPFDSKPLPLPPLSTGNKWQKGKLIGSGTFADVYEVFNSDNGSLCAMKVARLLSDAHKSNQSSEQLRQEILVLSRLKHDNIVQYIGTEMLEDRSYICLEYVSGGSIRKLLDDYGAFKEPVVRNYTRQILSGLAYLHNQNTVHRDIKGANILVDTSGRMKLADFGMAKLMSTESLLQSSEGSPYWMAPEVIKIKKPGSYDLSADIWSLGCTMIEMVTTKPPWQQFSNPVAVLFHVGDSEELPTIPQTLSSEGQDFLRLCFQRDPARRPTAAQLREHPFVKGDTLAGADLLPSTTPASGPVKATFTVNAARRFRYTLDIKKFEEQQRFMKDPASRLRAGTQVIRAVERFKQAGRGAEQDEPPEGFGVGPKTLIHLLQDRKLPDFEKLGGIRGLVGKLGTHLEDGVKDDPVEIQKRKEAYGSNTYPKKKPKGILHFVWEACQDTTLIILMVAAVVSLGTEMWSQGVKEGWYDGTAILVAVLIVIVTTAGSDYKQSLQFRNLNDEKENIHLSVIRGGERKQVSIWDLVVGDVIPLSIGGQVPADGVLIEGHSLTIDESTMTGESEPVKKDSKRPFLMSGCKVQDGQGIMLVTGVGVNTASGQVMASVSEDNGEETPLQVRLNGVATFIGKVGLTVAGLVFIILLILFFAKDYKKPENNKSSKIIVRIVEIFSIAVTIVVVAVPEGLPLAVTLTLAYSMRKMMADKSLVRHLAACETMGSATTICSDKTGTLTTNKMTVVRAWLGNGENDAVSADGVPPSLRRTLIHSICLNSTGTVSAAKGGAEPVVSGSPTESACLGWGLKLGMDFKQLRQANSILHVETFNSTKKRAGVVFKNDEGIVEAHWKGAAEIVLGLCTRFVDENGGVQVMTPEKNNELKSVIEGMAAKSLRCIAFAYRPIEGSDVPTSEEASSEWSQPEDDLILMGICGIKDPCRPGVRDAVERCQHAGVKVRMVTGDNKFTAKAIAQECGILKEDGLVVEGPDFRTWDEARLNRDLEKLVVMARSSPTDKLKLVKALKQRGNVVAVTGDGTNDAPALHEADIGLSMGISGTEVAKESSDIIILDDNFTSVVKVVRWGRSVYSNIQKFIQFQLTVNVTALTINFVSSISTGEVPLTAVQLLWVNLIMDTLGALALATEPPTDDLMERTPVGRTEPLITNSMWRNILAQALFQIVVLLTLDFAGNTILSLAVNDGPTDRSLIGDDNEPRDILRTTIIFNAFVFCQIFNEINARRPTTLNIFQGILKNHLFMGIIVVEVILQFVIVQYLNRFARTTKLEVKWWGLCIAIGFISWPVGFVVKFIPVPKKQFQPNFNAYCGRRKKI